MTNYNDGGPAFPQTRVWDAARAEYEGTQQYHGMTLRDWFAGQFMAAAMTGVEGLGTVSKDERKVLLLEVAGIVYETADAMLEARAKK